MHLREAVDYLNLLTQTELRDLFLEQGIKGKRRCSHGCIVAKYLMKVTGCVVAVTNEFVYHYFTEYPTSGTLKMFIVNFDTGLYPELVEEHVSPLEKMI